MPPYKFFFFYFTEKKKTPRRKPLLKNNKTGPCPFADLANDQKAQMCNSFSPAKQKSSENISFPLIEGSGNKKRIRSAKLFAENANPFVVVNHVRDRRKSDQELKPLKQFEFEMKPISNFRQSLESQENASAQRNSTFNLKMAGGFLRTEKIPPLKVNNRLNNTKEILLDVMQLRN